MDTMKASAEVFSVYGFNADEVCCPLCGVPRMLVGRQGTAYCQNPACECFHISVLPCEYTDCTPEWRAVSKEEW